MKEEEKIVLIRENVNAELQLLKAQIHPHFLFNTLNNIYSFTLVKSRMAGELILKLSDTLQYMINDCKASHVPLVKELKIIEDFIDLQKVRYGNRLQLQVAIEGNAENKFITPLLLIPFVENCFKHGTSKMLDYPWLKLEIEIMDKVLFFRLSNSKPSQVSVASTNSGIGLKNVQKRLALLYPLTHVIQFTSDDHSFTVHLEVPLNEELIADDVYLEKPNFYA
ncbi:MAG: histidine kinase [Bacteroidota bacterium]